MKTVSFLIVLMAMASLSAIAQPHNGFSLFSDAFGNPPDTVKVDSAFLVIGNAIIGKYEFWLTIDSAGNKTRYIVFPEDVAVAWANALHGKETLPSDTGSSLEKWKKKFLDTAPQQKR